MVGQDFAFEMQVAQLILADDKVSRQTAPLKTSLLKAARAQDIGLLLSDQTSRVRQLTPENRHFRGMQPRPINSLAVSENPEPLIVARFASKWCV